MQKKDTADKKFWERAAFLYTPFMEKDHAFYITLCKKIAPYLKADMQVLEIACGTGQLTFTLAGRVRSWTATDFSANMVARAQKRYEKRGLVKKALPGESVPRQGITFSVQDATRLPYAGETFDAVVVANALHIMPDPGRALEEIHRVLKPRGLLAAPTFVYQDRAPGFKIKLLERFGFRTYHRWNSAQLSAFVKSKGFEILSRAAMQGALLPECCLIGRKK